MSKSKIGIGVLSFAHGHVGMYAQVLKTFEDVELIACWDDDEARGSANSAAFGIPWSPHLEDVLGRRDIDCVIIGSETNKHAMLAVAAMEAGKDVLVQKPMAISLEDCDSIIEAADKTGVWFSVAFQMRCDPQNIHMRRLVQDGRLGRIGYIRRRHCIGVLFSPSFYEGATKWHVSKEANRGMFFDDAIHALDWLYWTMGEKPESVIAEIDNVLTIIAPDDTGLAVYRFEGGAFASIYNSSVTLAGENTSEIYGDKGVIIQNFGDGPSNMLAAPGSVGVKLFEQANAGLGWQDQGIPVPGGHGERIAGVTRPFIDAYRVGQPMCSARDGRVSVEMCLAAYRAAEAGKRVSLPFDENN